ncbi:tRNA pseudouridine synthase A [Williamsoniiplasma somnilux]|uniref:tRNA pseudouridine synthase A n=2 Tax=Williamsoniiplasma somnilux TaxID=215578 RepID=A0A2K8NXI9_9MOLU|nr:tRNA pseudouridine synthase A [Williamsoniiplasma somnilux]
MMSLLLTLAYDGSDYSGWVIQKKHLTIQGELNKAIKNVIKNNDFKTIGSSKTDAHVHASDQKVLLTINFEIKNLERFQQALNKALSTAIQILSIEIVSSDFNIRHARQKEYEYTLNDVDTNVFSARFEEQWKYGKIDIAKLQSILKVFIGEHDFKLFSGLSLEEQKTITTVRTIENIKVLRIDNKVKIIFNGKAFIRYQIRMIVGTALKAYLGKVSLSTISEKLQGSGTKLPYVANAAGLCLKKIIF